MSTIQAVTYDDGIAITVGKVYTKPFAAFYTGNTTSVTLVTAVGSALALTNLLTGTIYPIAFQAITVGAGIVGLRAMPFPGSS